MTETLDFAMERLVRRTPEVPVPLCDHDHAYIMTCLTALQDQFGIAAVPDIPLSHLPARTLMRRLVDWRAGLRPRNAEQRDAWGRIPSAMLLLETACAFAADRARLGQG